MFNAPIHGSQINPPAKLYKMFTPTEEIETDNIIVYQNNYYRHYTSFRYIEVSDMNMGDEQPIQGLISGVGYMTIKYNGKYKSDKTEPDHGDIVKIGTELWIITDSIQKIRHKMLKNMAVVYLPLKKLI